MLNAPDGGEWLEVQEERVEADAVEKFRLATGTRHVTGMPPTFITLFRHAEYEWLNRLDVDMRHLLHAEQEYEYLRPLSVGDEPLVRTRLLEFRERRRPTEIMRFMKFESEMKVRGETILISRTIFVVRQPAGERRPA